MIKSLLLTLLVFTLAAPVFASSSKTTKIYVWRNEQGVLVFSDSPRADAKEVKLQPDNVIQSQTEYNTEVLDITPTVALEQYEIFINTPKNNATIRDNTGSIYIDGGIKPRFKSGLQVQLQLDGKPYNKPQAHSMFSLRNIDRGEHKIKMLLLDEKGKVIASSESVTFYMHRASSQ
ncbi:DUF4124 domain-containing protein [Colwellia sp. E2M01]|uniref:DUF4124 domain-containing protein n=1 Tax=Colwellia sp. E2M01 TaxID=2841561 RepID=UPI001C08A1EC|nr:DUF4124 domain-containing protein [Colwellia sp. E2M01]MBU2871441.1 DUF4124 domain-containing protein [Colwellia sp. E2M01]